MSLLDVTEKVCLPIIIGILTLAFPILLQSISRIDEKYNTSVLTKRFKKEKTYKYFNRTLYVSLIYVFIHFAVFNFIAWAFGFAIEEDGLLEKLSSTILILCTAALVAILTLLIRRIMVYYDHSELLKNINERLKSFDDGNAAVINEYLAISNYIIDKNDDIFCATNALYKLQEYATDKYEKNEEFSESFYDTISILNMKLCQKKCKTKSIINGNQLLQILLPSPFISEKNIVISNDTYFSLAGGLSVQLKYKKTQWVLKYWYSASQYYESKKEEDTNFVDFHVWLAAMLLYKEEYNSLTLLLNTTYETFNNSMLVPLSFSKIISSFIRISQIKEYSTTFQTPYDNFSTNRVSRQEENQVFEKSYLSLLLFRLNAKGIADLSSGRAWEFPELPTELKELHNWLKYIKVLKTEAENWNRNRNDEAFKTFKIIPERETENNPIQKLEELINDIEKKIKELKQEENKQ